MAFNLMIWILTILSFKLIEGQTLPEGDTDRTTECAGDFLRGSCPTDKFIAVKDVKYGTKPTSTCSNATLCCDYDAADCFDPPYTGTTQQAACSGRGICNDVSIGEEDTSVCGATYPGLNTYLTMEYYCISNSRIGSSSAATLEVTGNLLYLQNSDYPGGTIRASERNISCSVETTACTAQISVYFLHFELSDGSSCTDTQNLQIVDKSITQTYTCSDNTDYTITQKLTSASNYLSITLNNPGGTASGKFWIGFGATESTAPLTVNCPAASQVRCMDCPALNISNGSVSTSDGLSTGKSASYSCEPGFDLLGNTIRTCLETGQWSGQEPTCQIKECSILTNPPNGEVSTDGVSTVGKNATYECNYGYELQGEESRTCQLNATWDGNEPVCTAIVCSDLNNPANGKVTTDSGLTVDQTAIYECNSGYSLSGNSSRTCQLDGTWSGDKPTCVLIEACPGLSSPENGQVSTDGDTIGSQATYSCSSGFIISNDAARVCQSNYTWSGTQPTCTKRELGDPCTSEADCLDPIPESTCKNNTCVCPEGTKVEGKQCVRHGESKPGGDDKTPVWVWIIIGVGVPLVLVLIIAVICYLRCRKRYVPENQRNEKTRQENHLIDDSDQYQMDYEKTKNVEKDTNAYANNAYQQESVQTNHILVDEVGGKDENIDQTEKAGKQSNGEIKPPVDKDAEPVMFKETTKRDDKDVEQFSRLPYQHTDPPDQHQTALDTNRGLQENSNTNLNNKGTEIAQGNVMPKVGGRDENIDQTEKAGKQSNGEIKPPVDKDAEPVMFKETTKRDDKDVVQFSRLPYQHTDPPDQHQTALDTNRGLQENSNTNLNNKGTEIAQGNVMPKKAGKQSNGEIKPPVDKDAEPVMFKETRKRDDKDVEQFSRLPYQHTDPPDQDQTALDTNRGLQENSNTNLNNKGTEIAQGNVKPKKTEEQVSKTIDPPVDKESESFMFGQNSEHDYKDDQEFNSIPNNTTEHTGEEQSELPKHEVGFQQDEDTEPLSERPDSLEDNIKYENLKVHNESINESKYPETANKDSIEATEEEIIDAVNLDERFSEAGDLIKDVTTALFRSASIAKKEFVAKASLAGFSFDTTEDGEWSKGLISAAKSVLAAIFSMCSIANEVVEGKASEEKINAATKEVKRATNALVVAYNVEGYSESDSVQKLKTACGEVNKAAESLLNSASSKYSTGSEPKSATKKSIALDSSEVQKALKRIEAQETVMRKEKELEEAQRAKALLNEEQNKFETETTETTEL